MEKDLFYYLFEQNEERYSEIYNLICSIENAENLTDEQLSFLRDFYSRLLFRIAVLEYKGYSDSKISNSLDIIKGISLFDETKVKELKKKFGIIIDKMKEMLEQLSNETIISENMYLMERGRNSGKRK